MVVLITGASSGIGKALAEYLSCKGHVVYGTSRNAPIEEVTYSADHDKSFMMLRMDVWDTASVEGSISALYKREGRVDLVVNNAGISIQGAVEDISVNEFKQEFETNLFGAIRVCQAVLPIMRKQRNGYIINISSLAGQIGIPFDGGYSASKFALEGLTEALRIEVKPFGIKVSLIEPGDINTGMSSHSLKAVNAMINPAYRENFQKAVSATAENEKSGSSPQRIAFLIEKIINNPSPKLRYIGGSLLDRLIPMFKKVMPSEVFEYLIMRTYKLT